MLVIRYDLGETAQRASMTDVEQVYAEYVEARSFGCKKCGYTSTNRRVVEQHLRQSHKDLFRGVTPAPGSAPAAPASGDRHVATGAVPAPPSTDLSGGRSSPHMQAGTAAEPPFPPVMDSPEAGPRKVPAVPPGAQAATGEVVLYTDAGTWDNGTSRQRSVLAVWDSRRQGIVAHEELPGTTNNEAEYAAIIAALELARHDGLTGVLIRSDSELCVKQIKGAYQVKEERLRPLRDRAARLLNDVRGRIEWVPRERNHAGIFLEKKYKG